MRKHLLTVAMLATSLSPFVARAQSDEGGDESPGGQEGAVDVAQPAPEPEATKREAANVRHTVEKGDTLWDLSQRFLGSPWYWPKVWSYNPEIANPHWIYPGNLVRFFGGGEEVPTQVQVGQVDADNVDEGSLVGDDDRVLVTGQIGYRVKPAQTISVPGFVTPVEVEAAGRIKGSFAETLMLTYPNNLYVEFANGRRAKVGETYVVFRRGGELLHPVTTAPVGFYTQILGEARVTRVEKGGVAVFEIVRQFDEIQRGDYIGPSGESLIRKLAARPADRDVKDGVVVSGTATYHFMFAEHATIIIDRGSDHGVKTGNVFHITRQHDALPQSVVLNPTIVDEDMPREDVGQCVALEVKSQATVCLLSRSLREIVRGDRAEVRAGSGSRAAR